MLVTYIKDAAGIPAGTVKNLPDKLAAKMVDMGACVYGAEGLADVLAIADTVVEEKDSDFLETSEYIEEKENTEAVYRKTKEDKKATKRNTK